MQTLKKVGVVDSLCCFVAGFFFFFFFFFLGGGGGLLVFSVRWGRGVRKDPRSYVGKRSSNTHFKID